MILNADQIARLKNAAGTRELEVREGYMGYTLWIGRGELEMIIESHELLRLAMTNAQKRHQELSEENARLKDEAATCRCPDQSYADREIARLRRQAIRWLALIADFTEFDGCDGQHNAICLFCRQDAGTDHLEHCDLLAARAELAALRGERGTE